MIKHNHLFYEFVVREKYKDNGLYAVYIGYEKQFIINGVSLRIVFNNAEVKDIYFDFETLEKYELKYRAEKINKIKECIHLKK